MKSIKTYAWYFPNWHVTPLNEKLHGKGWTEWECLKCAAPRFEGHKQPKKPLWGYEDESDPKVFEKKIDAAIKYGVDGFIFDFYWYKETGPYRIDCLEKGFLKASNCANVEFSVMWCNHDPIYVHPAAYMHDSVKILSGDADKEFFNEVTDYCITNYFPLENYTRIDGKVLFGIWNIEKLIENFGGVKETAEVFADFRKRAKDSGFEIHITANNYLIPHFKKDWNKFNALVKELGIDSIFVYSWPKPESTEWPKVDYADCRALAAKENALYTESVSVPYNIAVSSGWDSSPRTVQSDMYDNVGYPYTSIMVNNTPEEVKKSFEDARSFIESDLFTGKFMTLSCWNEWTEGSYFEPDEEYGYGYLEAFSDVFKN